MVNLNFLLPGAPCLSFDVLLDDLGDRRETYPLTCYMVAGTQSERGKTNHVIVMKMSNLYRTSKPDKEKGSTDDDNEDESSSESEDEDEKPDLETAVLTHSSGCVNRIRVKFQAFGDGCVPQIFFYFSTKTYVVVLKKNRLNETVLFSTQNICLKLRVRKYLQFYAEIFCLSRPTYSSMFLINPIPASHDFCSLHSYLLLKVLR